MGTTLSAGRSSTLLAACVLAGCAPAPPYEPAAVPPSVPIARAKAVFIANGGGDPFPVLSGGPDRAYAEFYAAMKAWGRYTVVSSPAQADVVITVSFKVTTIGSGRDAYDDTQIIAAVSDPKTHTPLWNFSEHLGNRLLCFEACHDQFFEDALAQIVNDMRPVADSRPAVTAASLEPRAPRSIDDPPTNPTPPP